MVGTTEERDDLFDNPEEEVEDELAAAIPEAELKSLQRNVRLSNKYRLEETRTRNILIVGKTRSGKSTATGVMKDPCYIPKEMSIFSDTVDPKFQSFSLDNQNDGTKYTVNIIDTPGLKEVKEVGQDARSDESILNTIQYCLKNEITKINVLLIFISFELGVTSDDLDSFATFLKYFGHENACVCMCITRAEDKPLSWRKNIITQLKSHPYFKEILDDSDGKSPKCQVEFIGCVDQVKLQTISSIDDLKKQYVTVYRLRESLLKRVFNAEQQVKLIDLPISTGILEELKGIFEAQEKILNRLDGYSEFATSEAKLAVDDFARNIKKMLKFEGLLHDENQHKLFIAMKERVRKIAEKMPADVRKEFTARLVI